MPSKPETDNYSFDSNNSSFQLNLSPKLNQHTNQCNKNTIIDNNKNVDDNFIHFK